MMRSRLLAVLSAVVTLLTLVYAAPATAATKNLTLYVLQKTPCANVADESDYARVLSVKKSGANPCNALPGFKGPETYSSDPKVRPILSRSGGWVTGRIYIRSSTLFNTDDYSIRSFFGYADVTVAVTMNGKSVGRSQFAGVITPVAPLVKNLKYKLPSTLKGKRLSKAVLTVTWNNYIGHTMVGMTGDMLSRIVLPYSTR